jgi:hypothetical protein
MKRVDGCAYIFMADKPHKIAAIMADREVTELEAGRIYVIGALKAAKRRGTAGTYLDALRNLEDEQAGDRSNPLTRSLSADATARVVSRCRRINDKSAMRVATVDVVRMAWARMDNQPLTAYVQPQTWRTEESNIGEAGAPRARSVGKVLGTLYTQIEEQQEQLNPEYAFINTRVELNYRRFFQEYKSRLSRTVRTRLAELMGYIRRESNGGALKAERVIKGITSRRGRKAPETSKLAAFAINLHHNFPHKDAVTVVEFVTLVYKYGGEPV